MPPISNVHIIYPPVRVGSLKCSLPTEEDEETLSYTRGTASPRRPALLTGWMTARLVLSSPTRRAELQVGGGSAITGAVAGADNNSAPCWPLLKPAFTGNPTGASTTTSRLSDSDRYAVDVKAGECLLTTKPGVTLLVLEATSPPATFRSSSCCQRMKTTSELLHNKPVFRSCYCQVPYRSVLSPFWTLTPERESS